nr:protein FANTASTIC FOUR 3-like [Ipomoea batatas]
MSTIAYNQDNLLSCLESHIIETATLKLKLSSPRCIDLGGWGFLQSLPNTSMEKGKQPTYVHPLSKQYSSYCYKLSEISLKLCTENLGSETGTDIADTAIFSSDFLPESALPPLPRQVAAPRNRKKVKGKPTNFPPPLTTLIAPNSLQVRSRREGGRLIIVAIEGPPKHAFFKAERRDIGERGHRSTPVAIDERKSSTIAVAMLAGNRGGLVPVVVLSIAASDFQVSRQHHRSRHPASLQASSSPALQPPILHGSITSKSPILA